MIRRTTRRVSYSGYYVAFPRLRGGFNSLYPLQANLAQLVEQCFRKAEVPGSNPGIGSRKNTPKQGVFFVDKEILSLLTRVSPFFLEVVYMANKSSKAKKQGANKAQRILIKLEDAPPLIERVPGMPVCDLLAVVLCRGEQVPYKCGHTYEEEFFFCLYGVMFKVASKEAEDRAHCGDCFVKIVAETTVRCARCGHVIDVGEGVAAYAYPSESFKPEDEQPWYKFIQHDDGQKSVIGCIRQACCPSGAFFAGTWTEHGFEPAFPGGFSIAATAFETGGVVIYNII